MKKLMILAAALLLVSSAFASPALNAGRLFVQPNDTFLGGSPSTTDNDDSCDIAVTPAATLLLPYFEVGGDGDGDIGDDQRTTVNTLFTITNVSNQPAVAHVTIWTDWSFPVIDFNIYLTGYDVQGVSLWDVLHDGVIPSTTSDDDGGLISAGGEFGDSVINPTSNCEVIQSTMPPTLREAVVSALTTGVYFSGSFGCEDASVGGDHPDLAIGYITIDVAQDCTQGLPTDGDVYFETTIAFDNVLIGDYQRINPNEDLAIGNYAGGNPLVHIRAVPEADEVRSTTFGEDSANLPFTFYDRYESGGGLDRRQPLPALWAARFVDDAENGGLGTRLQIWREGVTGTTGENPCDGSFDANSEIAITRIVRFDEHENPTVGEDCTFSPCPGEVGLNPLPETSATDIGDTSIFPEAASGSTDAGGWLFLNLSSGMDIDGTDDSFRGGEGFPSQNWVTLQMTAEGRFAVDFDAAYLGNGCTPYIEPDAFGNEASGDAEDIGPAPNEFFWLD